MQMKILIAGIFLFIVYFSAFAQVSISPNDTLPDPSAMLDVQSSSKGVLVPRMTSAQRLSINNPAHGLIVFDTNTSSFWFWNSSFWSELGSESPWIDARSYPYLDSLLAAVGSQEVSVLIADTIDFMNNNLVIPDNVSLDFFRAGKIQIGNGQTLSIAGPLRADLHKIFEVGYGGKLIIKGSVKPSIFPEWWGARADSLTNSTFAIQQAIDALESGGIVQFGPGIYRSSTISCKSNVSFSFTSGTTIRAVDGLQSDLFALEDVENIHFMGNGGTIQGAGIDSSSNTQQINIAMRGARDVHIENLTTKDAAFDGLYIGNGENIETAAKCERIFIKDVIAESNGRQGLSIISGADIWVENCLFLNTGGLEPGWGVDIEADASYHVLSDIILKDCVADGNANAGFGVYGGVMNDSIDVNIRFEGCVAKNSKGVGINIYGFKKEFKGIIQVNNCVLKDNEDYGFWISNKRDSTAQILINNLTLINNATKAPSLLGEARLGSGNGLGADTQFIIYHNNSAEFTPAGGILLRGLNIIDHVRKRPPILINHSGGLPWNSIRTFDITYNGKIE